MPVSFNNWLEEWMNLCYDVRSSRVWKVVFHTVCWSIWESMNDVIFNQGLADAGMVAELVRWMVVWWFKNYGPGAPTSPTIMILNPKVGCVDSSKIRRKTVIRWCHPPEGAFMFNVDGSSRGNPGPSGIGGILRNHVGDTICMFSSFLGMGLSSSFAEIFVILKACELYEKESCPAVNRIIIESDSKSVVSWTNGGVGVGNVRMMDIIMDIREILSRNSPKRSSLPREVAMFLLIFSLSWVP
ncbi:hypothetical protein Ddye_013622 [Dipteronia dyeriana]|uniref:RNase H type-1 domain-containing protein n=1 Tax=Dipteronia dyeriana TaxID=168575 RepID=A0AAD9X6R1_9ROSI|nr:hypothetical protein Ddye_013622 [Dipteronia dyeriana]